MRTAGPPIAVLLAAGASVGFNAGKVPISLPALGAHFGLDLVASSFMLSMLVIAALTTGVFSGMLADRFGQRRCLLAGLTLTAAGGLLGAVAQTPAQLFASRAVESVAFLATVLPGPAIIARIVSPRRLRLTMSLWSCYMPFGMAVALVAAPAVLAVAGWRAVWLANAVASAVLGVLVWRLVPADAPAAVPGAVPAAMPAALPAAAAAATAGWRAKIRATVGSPGPWLLAVCFGCYAGQWIGLFGFLPTLYAGQGIALSTAGLLTAFGVAANMIGNVGAGLLAQRGIALGRVIGAGAAVMPVCAAIVFAPDVPFALQYAAVVVFSAAGGLVPGSLFVTTPAFAPTPTTVSTTNGLMQQGSAFGQFATPPLLAAIVSATGNWSASLIVIGLLAVVTIVTGIAIGRRLSG